MPRNTIAFELSLCLSITLTGCGVLAAKPKAPPSLVDIPRYVDLPAACRQLRPVALPDGSTAQTVIEAQAAAILEYEAQVKECAKPAPK